MHNIGLELLPIGVIWGGGSLHKIIQPPRNLGKKPLKEIKVGQKLIDIKQKYFHKLMM